MKEMERQDGEMDDLLVVIKRQREIGVMMGVELDRQNKQLDELSSDVDIITQRQEMGQKRLDKIG